MCDVERSLSQLLDENVYERVIEHAAVDGVSPRSVVNDICLTAIVVVIVLAMFGSCIGGGSRDASSSRDSTARQVVMDSSSVETTVDVTQGGVQISDATATVDEESTYHTLTVTCHIHNGTDDNIHSSDIPKLVVGESTYGCHASIKNDEKGYTYLRAGEDGSISWEVMMLGDLVATCSFENTSGSIGGLDDVQRAVEQAISEHVEADAEAERLKEEERQAEEERREQERAAREAEEAARPKTDEELLQERLDVAVAMTAMEQYGQSQYPYGFKLNIWADNNQDVAEDENTWFLRYEVTITNAFGAEYKATACARVSGTTDSPYVEEFWVA